MFLAKKRFRIIREESLEEGHEKGLEEGRAESAAAIQELREEIRRLRNGANGADGANQANSPTNSQEYLLCSWLENVSVLLVRKALPRGWRDRWPKQARSNSPPALPPHVRKPSAKAILTSTTLCVIYSDASAFR